MSNLSHFDEQGAARMVDVSAKPVSERMARASGNVVMAPSTLEQILNRDIDKGDVLGVARVAGIMAAKRTSDLIPMCHPLGLDSVRIEFRGMDKNTLHIECVVTSRGRTGVEMEALTGVSVTALTVYDMCKSVDRGITFGDIRLEEKCGGKSGHYVRQPAGE